MHCALNHSNMACYNAARLYSAAYMNHTQYPCGFRSIFGRKAAWILRSPHFKGPQKSVQPAHAFSSPKTAEAA
jgi:hypothetical protein